MRVNQNDHHLNVNIDKLQIFITREEKMTSLVRTHCIRAQLITKNCKNEGIDFIE